MALADSFYKSKKRILILEAGFEDWREQSQTIYTGTTSGYGHSEIDKDRTRQLGGSTNCWGGSCVPFDPIDFELTENGRNLWPISYQELMPHYITAGNFYGIGDYFSFKHNMLAHYIFSDNIPGVAQKYWLANNKNKLFKDVYPNLTGNRSNIDLCLQANAIDIDFENSSSIKSVIVENYNQTKFSIKTKKVILACGGLESTRLLLNWAENHSQFSKILENLGLYYSPHIDIRSGSLVSFPGAINNIDSLDLTKDISALPFFNLSFKKSDQDKYLNSQWSLRARKYGIRGRRFWLWPEQLVENYSKQEIALMNYLAKENQLGEVFDFIVAFDQTPSSKSRVTLGVKKDRFNLKKINLHFHISDDDIGKIKNTYREIGRIFGQNKIGRLSLGEIDNYLSHNQVGAHHHTGTIRMADSAKYGCVDRNLKIFGVDNLWVCSSAVFPSPSQANPTFTIMALAKRLAENIDNEKLHY
jgi:hypothetical protein